MSKPDDISAAEDDVAFFENAEKKRRERWVAEHWCRATCRDPSALVDSEDPDFLLGGRGVEITEVQLPDRRRHAEFKQDLADVNSGKRPAPRDDLDLEEVRSSAHDWVSQTIEKKAKHYGPSGRTWILVVYVNLSFCDQIRWELVRASLNSAQPAFAEVHALFASGSESERLFP